MNPQGAPVSDCTEVCSGDDRSHPLMWQLQHLSSVKSDAADEKRLSRPDYWGTDVQAADHKEDS